MSISTICSGIPRFATPRNLDFVDRFEGPQPTKTRATRIGPSRKVMYLSRDTLVLLYLSTYLPIEIPFVPVLI